MNLRSDLFLAWRYLKPKRNAVSVITCVSLAGVMLGVAVLIVVLSVMTGFTDLMKSKLLETRAHLQIYDIFSDCIKKPAAVVKAMAECGIKGTPIVNSQALIQKGQRFVPKAVIGIDPQQLDGRFNLKEVIKFGECRLDKGEVMVSTEIADELKVGVGDKILVHAPSRLAKMIKVNEKGGVEMSRSGEAYLPEEYRITALYSFGKWDFDRSIVFLNLEDADELFDLPWGAANAVYGWTDDPFNLEPAVARLQEKLPETRIYTWKQLNQRLLGVLAVEKRMMFFLLIFIVLVAAFSIANTLITVVIQKTREIGLLKSLGASSLAVMRIFILQGFFVGLLGSIFGTALGVTVVYYRNILNHFLSNLTGQDLFPKEFYYFNEIPAHIVTDDILVIGISSIILCTLGAVIPAWRAARLDPAKALRNE